MADPDLELGAKVGSETLSDDVVAWLLERHGLVELDPGTVDVLTAGREQRLRDRLVGWAA